MSIEIRDGLVHYDCGCKFEIVDEGPPIRIRPGFKEVRDAPLNCSLTWDMLSEHCIQGVFQLESPFGQQSTRRLKPTNMEELAALSAILRPGSLNAFEDGKAVTYHYMDRKNVLEDNVCKYPVLEPILGPTYNCLIYQEQSMKIVQEIAGFSLQEADILRKAIGKKKADIMAEVKVDFINRCKDVGMVTEEEASEIFSWIEASQRYQFNKSHAIAYAYNCYMSAYLRAHFIAAFYTSWLHYARFKQKPVIEIKKLYSTAKLCNVDILPAQFYNDNLTFKRIQGRQIYFGFTDIRGMGVSRVNKMKEAIYQANQVINKPRKDWFWIEFLSVMTPLKKCDKTTVEALIESGSLGYMKVPRTRMLFEYEQYSVLTEKESAWIVKYMYDDITSGKITTTLELIKASLAKERVLKPDGKYDKFCSNKNRTAIIEDLVKTIENPPYSMEDSADWICRVEEAKLGVSITASILDTCKNTDQANCSIEEFIKRQNHSTAVFIAGQIEQLTIYCPPEGTDEMAFVKLTDSDLTISCVMFSDVWQEANKNGACFEQNMVLVSGERSQRKPEELIIRKMWQLT